METVKASSIPQPGNAIDPQGMRQFLISRRRVLLGSFFFLAATLLGYTAFESNYRLVFDEQNGPTCLPWDLFLVEKAPVTPQRGDLFLFEGRELFRPFFKFDQKAVKRVAAVAGDHVRVEGVEAGRTYINGIPWPTTLTVVELFPGANPEKFAFDGVVPDGHVFMLGTLPNSYDSRYYGFVDVEQLIGKAYAIF